MLSTQARHEFPSFAFSQGQGYQTWRLVNLDLRMPYFLVSHAHKKRKTWNCQTSLLWHEDDLLNFCRETRTNTTQKIHQVAMMLPIDTGGLKTWRMLSLHEIWLGQIRDIDQRAMVYVADDGERVVNSLVTKDERMVELIVMEFQVPSDTHGIRKIACHGQ